VRGSCYLLDRIMSALILLWVCYRRSELNLSHGSHMEKIYIHTDQVLFFKDLSSRFVFNVDKV
jgi:hypothetical protein